MRHTLKTWLTFVILGMFAPSAFATEKVCKSSKIRTTLFGRDLEAQVSLKFDPQTAAFPNAKLEGYYIEPDGSRTTMEKLANQSGVDALSISGGYASPDFAYGITMSYLLGQLAEVSANTRNINLKTYAFMTDITAESCQVIGGTKYCGEGKAPFIHYIELNDSNNQRIVGVASIAGGLYMFTCE